VRTALPRLAAGSSPQDNAPGAQLAQRWGDFLMGLFDGLLGGIVGAEMATVVNSLIQQHGGIQGVVAQLERQGLGGVARSWVSQGANGTISPAKAGISPQELAAKLSQALPTAIDKLTPNGTIPQSG
jgi:uncharacterized protein YidB (DUF937 family)